MASQGSRDYQVVNQNAYLRSGEDEVEYKLDIYHKIARHLWAIMILIAQLSTGVKPNWKKN